MAKGSSSGQGAGGSGHKSGSSSGSSVGSASHSRTSTGSGVKSGGKASSTLTSKSQRQSWTADQWAHVSGMVQAKGFKAVNFWQMSQDTGISTKQLRDDLGPIYKDK